MIRAGTSFDSFALVEILKERHAETRYHGHVAIDEPVARKMFAQAAMRHGHTTEGGAWLMVNTVPDRSDPLGRVNAFILGTLSRVYVVGDRLNASDVFLLGRKKANPRALLRLVDSYIAWAMNNPRVFEIGLSWADTIPGNEGVIRNFEQRGFALCGKTYRRDNHQHEQEQAA